MAKRMSKQAEAAAAAARKKIKTEERDRARSLAKSQNPPTPRVKDQPEASKSMIQRLLRTFRSLRLRRGRK